MRGIIQTIYGDPTSFVLSDYLEMPTPGPRDVLIRITYSAVNRPYYVLNKDGEPLPPGSSQVLGLEVVGHIVSIGLDCTMGFQEEEIVCALLHNGGGYAEFCTVDERQVFQAKIFAPQELSLPQLAAIPLAFMTAYHLCFLLGQIKAGDTVLLHAAASSLGQAALQMLVRKGVTVFATVRSQLKRSLCSELGAKYTFVVSIQNPKFADSVRLANRGRLIDCVLDPVGSAYLSENIEVLGVGGKIIVYGIMGGGAVVDSMFLSKMLGKRITITGDTLRSHSIEYRAELLQKLLRDPDAFQAIAKGDIRVQVDHVFIMEKVLEAHQLVAHNGNTGKVVLDITSSSKAVDFFETEMEKLFERNYFKHVNDRY